MSLLSSRKARPLTATAVGCDHRSVMGAPRIVRGGGGGTRGLRTTIVVLAALLNATKVLDKKMEDLRVVINGAGAAGIAIAKLLKGVNHKTDLRRVEVKEVILCDTKGILSKSREDLNSSKLAALEYSNLANQQGSLKDALVGADVFIGVSSANLLDRKDVRTMAPDPIILALANPTPEIMPDEAFAGGAAIVGTGRSDLPNQVNNVLGFPGIFRGALDARAKRITAGMKLAAAYAIADHLRNPTFDNIIPATLDESVAWLVADAVREAAKKEKY